MIEQEKYFAFMYVGFAGVGGFENHWHSQSYEFIPPRGKMVTAKMPKTLLNSMDSFSASSEQQLHSERSKCVRLYSGWNAVSCLYRDHG